MLSTKCAGLGRPAERDEQRKRRDGHGWGRTFHDILSVGSQLPDRSPLDGRSS